MQRFGIVTFTLLCALGLALEAGANARTQDSAQLLSQLDARADQIRVRLAGPRLGGVRRGELRDQLREIDEVSARIRAGGAAEPGHVARLLGRPDPQANSPAALAERLAARQEALDRNHSQAPKLNALQRDRIESQLSQLDQVIAALEDGSPQEIARAEALLGVQRPRTLAERQGALEIRRTSLQLDLVGGPRLGGIKREQIRREIEMLDDAIARLEGAR